MAHQSFALNSQTYADDISEEGDLIAPMLEECCKWKPPSELNATQLKVEYQFESIPVPVIGYLDMAFDGVDIDLKTTKACPSAPRAEHIRQVSIYRAARQRDGGLLYLTAKRHAYFPVDDQMMEEALNDLHAAALSLYNFLSRMDSKEDVLRSLPMDYDDFQAPKTRVPLADLLMAG